MELIFGPIRAPDAETYIRDRLAHWLPKESEDRPGSRPALIRHPVRTGEPPLMPFADLPVPPPEAEAMRDCALTSLAEQLPFLPGEVAQTEGFTCLTAPYAGQAPGTIVFARYTDMADLFVLFPNTAAIPPAGCSPCACPRRPTTAARSPRLPPILRTCSTNCLSSCSSSD